MIPHPKDEPRGGHPLPREELRHWLKVVRRLPEVRMQKIINARRAIQGHLYDDDDIIDWTIEQVCHDIGVNPGEEQ